MRSAERKESEVRNKKSEIRSQNMDGGYEDFVFFICVMRV